MRIQNPSAALTEAVRVRGCLHLPGAYDAFSAKLIQDSGFEAVYIGSYATAASDHNWPDVGVLTLDQLVRSAGEIVETVDVPVIADAEGGFFDAPNIWRTVSQFEATGVAAIHIEDHAGSKHTNVPQSLVPNETMLGRLRAALDARSNKEFIIIARTDAVWAMHDVDEAARRIEAFAQLGIEYIFPSGAMPNVLRELKIKAPHAKFVATTLPGVKDRSEWSGVAEIVLDYGFCLQSVAKNLALALSTFRSNSSVNASDALIESPADFEQRLGYDDYVKRYTKYAVKA